MLAAIAVLILLLLAKLVDPLPLVMVRYAVADWLQKTSPRMVPVSGVAIVDIDDASLAQLGQWPWPRRQIAGLVDRLAEAGARMVVLDVVFSEPDRVAPGDDAILANSLRRLPAVAAISLSRPAAGVSDAIPPPAAGFAIVGPDPLPHLPAYTGASLPLEQLRNSLAGWGAVNGLPDSDGGFRRLPLLFSAQGRLYPSMLAETMRVLMGDSTYRIKTAGGNGEFSLQTDSGVVALRIGQSPAAAITIPTDANGAFIVKLGEFPPEQTLSARDVLDGKADNGRLAGRVVFVGTSAPGLVDLHQTALGMLPGVEIDAQALSQILDGDFLRRPDWASGLELLLGAFGGAFLIALLPRLGALPGALLSLASLVGLGAATWMAFAHGHWLFDPGCPGLCVAGVYLTVTLATFRAADHERAFIRQAFSRYLSPTLVNELAADPKRLQIGGEQRTISIIYTDIGKFTTMTEQIGPKVLAPIINRYFDGASKIIMAHGGMVSQFAGDTILAYFNAPTDQPDHAARALACVRELDIFAERFRHLQLADGIAFGETRMGVHSGIAVVGNFGSSERFQYSALGDSLNTAARIEQLNKYFGTRICTSGETLSHCADRHVRPVGEVQVVGKSRHLEIFEVLAPARHETDFMRSYRHAYDALRRGDSDSAKELFMRLAETAPDDGPTRLHLARLELGQHGTKIVMDQK